MKPVFPIAVLFVAFTTLGSTAPGNQVTADYSTFRELPIDYQRLIAHYYLNHPDIKKDYDDERRLIIYSDLNSDGSPEFFIKPDLLSGQEACWRVLEIVGMQLREIARFPGCYMIFENDGEWNTLGAAQTIGSFSHRILYDYSSDKGQYAANRFVILTPRAEQGAAANP